MNLKEKINKLVTFIRTDIWDVSLEEFGRLRAQLIKYVMAFVIAIRTFSLQKIGFQCVALSYFCTMAVVPLLAMILFVLSRLGLDEYLYTYIHQIDIDSELVDRILTAAGHIISDAESGLFGLISALSFLWLVVWMLINISRVFNNVWNISQPRSITKRLFALVMIIANIPFFVLAIFAAPLEYSHLLEWLGISFPEELSLAFTWFAIYVFVVVAFTVMYKFIPATYVRPKYAFMSALVSGLFYIILQLIYVYTQVFITRVSSVYGTFAAVPLFMVWLNFGWWIILFGSELCYGYQNIDKYLKNYDIGVQ